MSEEKELTKTQKIFRDIMYKAIIEVAAERYLEMFKIYCILTRGTKQ